MLKQTIEIDELNPAFLYTWKGTRQEDEARYHNHDHLELAFVLSGEGRYRIEDRFYEVKEGDIILLNPGVKHQALLKEGVSQNTTEFFVGASDFSFEGCDLNCMPLPGDEFILHATGELKTKIARIIASMEAEKAVRRPGKYFMMKSYLLQLMLLIVREQCESDEPAGDCIFESTNKKYVVDQILNYFENHYSEKISLDQIAANMYLSTFYISRIFKSETGDTPIRHLINIRLEKARELLSSDYPGSIQEVALAVGYEDAYHFSKLFKRYYGITPTQARKTV